MADATVLKCAAMLGKFHCIDTLLTFSQLPWPAAQDRARIVFDCRMANDPAMMSSTNPVLHYVAGVLRAIVPPLVPWATCVLARARITQPEDNDVVIVGKIPVSGIYHFECGLSFVLLHHYGNNYWPQGSPVLDRTRHTWKKDVHIGPPVDDKHFVSIAAITEDARPLFNHYYQVGESTGQWNPITLYKLPNGLTILHTIRVQPKLA